MFYSIDRLSSNTESDFLSTATMQAHVRAVDATENSLLEIYRNAAIDYLQNLSDRVIGISDVVVTLSFNEMLDPVRLQKIQDITSISSTGLLRRVTLNTILRNYRTMRNTGTMLLRLLLRTHLVL